VFEMSSHEKIILTLGSFLMVLCTLSIGTQDTWADSTAGDQEPVATIVSVSPNSTTEEKQIRFVGKGTDDGSIVSYAWFSSIDKEFYNGTAAAFSHSGLSPGTHYIYLRVEDNNGSWSDETFTTVVVEEEDDELFLFRYIGPLPVIGHLIIVVVFVGLGVGVVKKRGAAGHESRPQIELAPPPSPPSQVPRGSQTELVALPSPPSQVPRDSQTELVPLPSGSTSKFPASRAQQRSGTALQQQTQQPKLPSSPVAVSSSPNPGSRPQQRAREAGIGTRSQQSMSPSQQEEQPQQQTQIPPRVTCPKCSTIITVDRSRVTPDGKVRIRCPSCGTSGSM